MDTSELYLYADQIICELYNYKRFLKDNDNLLNECNELIDVLEKEMFFLQKNIVNKEKLLSILKSYDELIEKINDYNFLIFAF